MPLSAARVSLHPPKRYALGFDGEDDYLEVADDPSLDLTENLAVEAMFMLYTSYSGYARILTRNGYTLLWEKTPYQLAVRYNQDIVFSIGDGSTYQSVGYSPPAEPNKWFHVFGVASDDLKLYINGELKNTKSRTINPTTTTNPLRLARAGTKYFPMKIAFIRIYNRALSASEIQHNCLNPMSPVLDGLVLWLKMEEGSGTTVHDYSGYGNDGTIYGATWIEITHDPVRTLSPLRILSNVR